MAERILDPRERKRHAAIRHLNAVNGDRHAAIVSGAKVPPKAAESIAKAEAAVAAAHRTSRKVECVGHRMGRAETVTIDLARDPHYRLTVNCLVRFFPGEPQPFMQYLSPGMHGRFEEGAAGVVVQLEPPSTGELAYCLDCAEVLVDYLNEQLVDTSSDQYHLHMRGLTPEGEVGEDHRKTSVTARQKRTRTRTPRKGK